MKKLRNSVLCMVAALLLCLLPITSAEASSSTKYLTDLDYTESNHSFDSSQYSEYSAGFTTPRSKTYKKGIVFMDASLSDCHVTYNLNKSYGKFTGVVTTCSDTGSGNFTIKIYGDGKLLKSIKNFTRDSKDKSISVDVSGVKTLKIEASNSGSYGNGYVFIANAELTKGVITLSDNSLELNQGDSTYVTWSYKASNGKTSTPSAKWKSSKSSVAKVSSKGKVVAVSTGTCKLTCTVKGLSKTVNVVVKPKKVSKVSTLSKTKNSIQLTWAAQKGVTKYQVYMYDKDLEEYTRVKTVNSSLTTARITGLKKNTSYKFKVRACLKSGKKTYNGDFSKVITVKTTK